MHQLKRELGLLNGTALMTTTLLGTGVFAIPAISASIAGPNALIAWPLITLFILPIALTFAHLGRQLPDAGGAAHFVEMAFGPNFKNIITILFLALIPVAIPALLTITTGFFLSSSSVSAANILTIKIVILISIGVLGFFGSKFFANIQTVIAALVAILISSLWVKGGVSFNHHMPTSSTLNPHLIAQASAQMFWCFIGIEAFVHMGEEFKKPKTEYPMALVFGVIIAGFVYWTCTAIVLDFNAYGTQWENTRSIPNIISKIFGSHLSWVAAVIGFLCCFAAINLYLQSLSRLLWSRTKISSKNTMLTWLSYTTPRGCPIVALIVILLISLVSLLIDKICNFSLDEQIGLTNGIILLIYLLSMMSAYKLFKHKKLAVLAIAVNLFISWLESIYIMD